MNASIKQILFEKQVLTLPVAIYISFETIKILILFN